MWNTFSINMIYLYCRTHECKSGDFTSLRSTSFYSKIYKHDGAQRMIYAWHKPNSTPHDYAALDII